MEMDESITFTPSVGCATKEEGLEIIDPALTGNGKQTPPRAYTPTVCAYTLTGGLRFLMYMYILFYYGRLFI